VTCQGNRATGDSNHLSVALYSVKLITSLRSVISRRFYSCSVAVKLRLFKSLCLCFYDAALWNHFTANKFRSAYVKCIKIFLDILNFIVLLLCSMS